jgi:phosphoglycolate phosphatase-like HAD superfamily hydrolase
VIYAFDLDNTLFRFLAEPDYENPKSLFQVTKPHAERCRMVRDLMLEGHAVFFITGRRETTRQVTRGQLQRWIHRTVKDGQLKMQECWTGYDAMSAWKARQLRRVKADVFIGDHQADADAAAKALVPFVHCDSWLEVTA